jgi:PAS domain S-box-containing protein
MSADRSRRNGGTGPGRTPREPELPPQAIEILESIHDAFYAVDHDWRFTYINRRAEEMWGLKREELQGRNLWEAFPFSVGGRVHQELLRAAAERQPAQFEVLSPVLGRWLDVSVYPGPSGISVYFRDITERKAAEEDRYWLLREAQSRAAELTAVMESLPDALFIGNEALITLANGAALEMLGCASVGDLNRRLPAVAERARLRDAGTGEVLPPERWPFFRALGGKPVTQDILVHHARWGRDVLLRCSATPVRAGGEIIGGFAIATDLMRSPERTLLRGLLQAQEEERRAIAYELHDGLTQYVMAAHAHLESFRWLQAEGDDGGTAGRELDRGIEHLRQAVLESRRLVSGLRALLLEDLGLAEALTQLVSEEKARAGWGKAEMTHNVAGRRFESVLETTLFRVAQEALTNVRKHARAERVQLQLLLDEETETPKLTLQIRDWGRGFVPEEKASDPNHLGLQGMLERVNLAGGSYRLQSAPGAGTTIRAVLPVGRRQQPQEEEIEAHGNTGAGERTR